MHGPPPVDPQADLPIAEVLGMYAAGWFPMDDPDRQDEPLPFYSPEERGVFALDEDALALARSVARRSLARPEAARWRLALDRAFAETVRACARPRHADDGVWLTPRMERLYVRLHRAGVCHTFELHDPDEGLIAGTVGVMFGRAVFLESMFHRVPHAGNVMLVRTLDLLARSGVLLCDVQMTTPHTERLGAHAISRWQYLARLQEALGQVDRPDA